MYCHCFFLVSGRMNDKLPPFKEITYTAGAFYRTLNINALNYPNHLMKSALLPSHFADEETEAQRVRESPRSSSWPVAGWCQQWALFSYYSRSETCGSLKEADYIISSLPHSQTLGLLFSFLIMSFSFWKVAF